MSDQQPQPRRGWPLLAWLVIVAIVVFLAVRVARRPASADPGVEQVTLLIQGRYLVGAARSGLPGLEGRDFYEQLQGQLKGGDGVSRLRLAILGNELVDPPEGRKQLARLRQDRLALPEQEQPLPELLDRLFAGYQKKGPAHVALKETEQQELRERLGWYGQLALAPSGGANPDLRATVLAAARRSFVVTLVLGLMALGGVVAGVVVLVVVIVLVATGRTRSALADLKPGAGGIYAEAFAVYLLLYLALGLLASWLSLPAPPLLVSAVCMLLSLLSLGWPVLRGVPWKQVRRDIGLTGRGGPGKEVENLPRSGSPVEQVIVRPVLPWEADNLPPSGPSVGQVTPLPSPGPVDNPHIPPSRPFREAALGVVAYLGALPLVGVAFLLVLFLTLLLKSVGNPLGPGNAPAHPLAGVALHANFWVWAQVFLVAVVLAPLVEEIAFRGLLYRHLRELNPRWGSLARAFFAAVIGSFVFAILHPQGLLGVPMLMSLAFAFSLARELRGSLLPCMVAHGLNNGAVTWFLFLVTA